MDTQEVIPTKQDKGFTLVELLIVIVILGILATITVFAVRGITDSAQDTACTADQRTIEAAVEAFYAGEGRYPASFAEMADGTTTGGDVYLANGADATKFSYTAATGTVTAIGVCA